MDNIKFMKTDENELMHNLIIVFNRRLWSVMFEVQPWSKVSTTSSVIDLLYATRSV